MAIDVYLQIEGIKGESADATHEGWIEVTSALFFESGLIQIVYFNDPMIPRVKPQRHHDDHFHVTIKATQGAS